MLRRGGVAVVVDNDVTRSTFGAWFRRSYPAYDPVAVQRFWDRQGFTTEPLTIRWTFDRRDDLEAVTRIELPPGPADEVLAGTRGSRSTTRSPCGGGGSDTPGGVRTVPPRRASQHPGGTIGASRHDLEDDRGHEGEHGCRRLAHRPRLRDDVRLLREAGHDGDPGRPRRAVGARLCGAGHGDGGRWPGPRPPPARGRHPVRGLRAGRGAVAEPGPRALDDGVRRRGRRGRGGAARAPHRAGRPHLGAVRPRPRRAAPRPGPRPDRGGVHVHGDGRGPRARLLRGARRHAREPAARPRRRS